MKPKILIRPGGVLSLSTAILLAGGAISQTSCNRHVKNIEQLAEEEMDSVQSQLSSGLVENNFKLPNVGYYHAAVQRFYDQSYNQNENGRWFVNGQWADSPGPAEVPASRPLSEELTKVETALSKEQETASLPGPDTSGSTPSTTDSSSTTPNPAVSGQNSTTHTYHHSSGIGNALMMYWLLSGNRNNYTPGNAFYRAGAQAPAWQEQMKRQPSYFRGTSPSFSSRSSSFSRSSSSSSSRSSSTGTAPSRGGFGSHGSGSFSGS